MIVDPYDWDDLDNHHPTCPNGCGQLADECMCNWKPYVEPKPEPEHELGCDGVVKERLNPFLLEIYGEEKIINVCDCDYWAIADDI